MAENKELERCRGCDEPTGRCGEDSWYLTFPDGTESGPLCDTCYETTLMEIKLIRLQAENARLRKALAYATSNEACREGYP